MTLRSSVAVRNACADAALDLLDAGASPGVLRIYTGSPPATPATAPTGTLLAELTFSDPAFAAATSGSRTASAITGDSSANASGVAGWFRMSDSDGNAVYDGTVTEVGGGGDLELDDTDVVAGGEVNIDTMVITYPQ